MIDHRIRMAARAFGKAQEDGDPWAVAYWRKVYARLRARRYAETVIMREETK